MVERRIGHGRATRTSPRTPFVVLAALAAVALLGARASASEIAGRVVGISDGDTLALLDGTQRQVRSRLAEIDGPSGGSPTARGRAKSSRRWPTAGGRVPWWWTRTATAGRWPGCTPTGAT
jgi:endonuclease YncB( thermonuclease family)